MYSDGFQYVLDIDRKQKKEINKWQIKIHNKIVNLDYTYNKKKKNNSIVWSLSIENVECTNTNSITILTADIYLFIYTFSTILYHFCPFFFFTISPLCTYLAAAIRAGVIANWIKLKNLMNFKYETIDFPLLIRTWVGKN